MTNVYKTVYQEALNYLAHKAGTEYVADQLKDNATISPVEAKTMNDLFRVFLDAAIGTKRMQEAIGPVEPLQKVLCGFDPMRLSSHYGEKWELLAGKFGIKGKYPRYRSPPIKIPIGPIGRCSAKPLYPVPVF